jgi:predicted ATPase
MVESTQGCYLLEVKLRRDSVPSFDAHPFSLPAIRHLDRLKLHPAVTFFVGENGTGKSMLLDAIAVAWGFNPEGASRTFRFATRASHAALHQHLRLIKSFRPRDGFFLRAESYFDVATAIEHMDAEPAPAPTIIDSYGGGSLPEQSHAESFFALIMQRFGGKGSYILDEPETALSPMQQHAMLQRIHEFVNDDSQVIIASHSPILMAYPNTVLPSLERGLEPITYAETDHFTTARSFLMDHARMIARLLGS